MRIHPHDALLCEALGRSKGSEKLLEHVEQCTKCQAKLAHRASADRFWRADYGPAFERSYQVLEQRQAALARERGEAPQLLARLIGLIPERQQLLLRNSRRFQTWGLLELLIQYGERETFIDPAHGEEIYRLALEVSTYLDSSFYGKDRIEDMRARALGSIGNARRIMMDLPASEEAFEEAFLRLRKGTADLRERAELLAQQASLRRAQQHYEESLRHLRRVVAIFEQTGEKHQVGKILVQVSITHYDVGNVREALSVLGRSFDLIDPVYEPRVALCALHNLTNYLTTTGRLLKAQKVFVQARPFYQRFGDPRIHNMQIWLQGRIAHGLGHHRDAEAFMTKARDGFLSVKASYESGLVARELASIRGQAGTAS
jgi:tetratricopeptide (TPR) repeat protein